MGFVAPDDGGDGSSIAQGFALGAMIAAAPIAVLTRPWSSDRVVSLGGGMIVAGVATMFGGNLIGFVLALAGLPILLTGAAQRPPLSLGVVGRLLNYTVLIVAAMWLSLGRTNLGLIFLSVVVSAIVATTGIWDRGAAGSGRDN